MPDNTSTAVEKPEQLGNTVARWTAEIKAYEKATETWRRDSKRIIDRYKLERQRRQPELQHRAQYNILWSNVKTASPALYSRTPLPSIERRHRDQDVVGRIAAAMMERAVSTDIELTNEEDEFDVVMKGLVLDYQLTGRGTVWVRYEATILEERRDLERREDETGREFIMDGERIVGPEEFEMDDDGPFVMDREVVDEGTALDFVYWEDFGHTSAKNWAELRKSGAIWRRVAMTRKELVGRFGDRGRKVPLKVLPEGVTDDKRSQASSKLKNVIKRAHVYEIWDADTKRIYWINIDTKDAPLDEKDFILDLTGKFPCPRPTFQTITNDSLIPIPDYLQYEDLADELDDLTERISVLQEALQARGLYDATMEGIGKLFTNTTPNNALIPVTNWAALQGKGGINGVVEWVPIRDIAQVILQIDERRERLNQQIFETTGLSDIIRGSTNPNETLGAQRIKGQFASLRLDEGQREIARVARDIVRLKAEIIAEQFDDATIREISGFDQMPEIVRMREQAQQAAQQPMQQGMQGPMPMATPMQGPDIEQVFQQALALIRNDRMRNFRIDIETDSTVVVDEEQMRQGRIEFLQAAGSFLQQALPVAQAVPQMAPLMGEMLLFGIRSFKTARGLESAFEDALESLQNAQGQQQDQGPSEAEMQAQMDQQRLQIDQQKIEADTQIRQQKIQSDMQLEQIKLEQQARVKEAELQLAREKASAEISLKQQVEEGRLQIEAARAQISNNPEVSVNLDAQDAMGRVAESLQSMVMEQNRVAQGSLEAITSLADRLSGPRRIVFENGRPVGVEPVN